MGRHYPFTNCADIRHADADIFNIFCFFVNSMECNLLVLFIFLIVFVFVQLCKLNSALGLVLRDIFPPPFCEQPGVFNHVFVFIRSCAVAFELQINVGFVCILCLCLGRPLVSCGNFFFPPSPAPLLFVLLGIYTAGRLFDVLCVCVLCFCRAHACLFALR